MMKKKKDSENDNPPIEKYFENNKSTLKEIKKNHILQMPGTHLPIKPIM